MILALTLIVISVGVFIMFVNLYFWQGVGKWLFHDIFGYHLPDENNSSFDGCSNHSKCRYCGKEITQDSQGNWY